MNFNILIDFCKNKYPEKMIEVCEAIDLLVDVLTNLKSDIFKEIPTLGEDDSYERAHKFLDYSENISKIIKKLNSISNDITIDEKLEDISKNISNKDGFDDRKDINYNDKSFDVDPKISHSVYEDFTYTKPAGIEIENIYLEANTWQDILNECCTYLYQKDSEIMNGFLDSDIMKGRSCQYFSKDPTNLRDPQLIYGSNIYVENNVSATFVRNLIIKMLEQYEIPKRQCHIFIRRDLTSAHNKNINIEETAKNIMEADDQIKIGQYAKEYFTSFFKTHTSESDIANFTDKDWCHDTFGICYPILKQVNIKLPISEQVNYNNQYRRYYSNPVLKINEKNYIICSQWFAQFKPKLVEWINSNAISIRLNEDEGILEIGEKLKFNKNFNSISILKILFVDILKTIRGYGSRYFETGYLAEIFSVRILRESGYEKPQHVINNIRKYLESEDIISLHANAKKGKYIVSDSDKLQSLIQKYDTKENNIGENNISVKQEVIVYSYFDKKQIIIDLNNPNDKYSFLHSYCINKKAGDRFTVQANEYVIVNFKKGQLIK